MDQLDQNGNAPWCSTAHGPIASLPALSQSHSMGRKRIPRITDLSGVDPNFSQAERVIECLGGVDHLAELLGMVGHPLVLSTIYRWTYPKERGGSGGLIPGFLWPVIFQCARLEGIILGPQELDPRPMPKRIRLCDAMGRYKVRSALKKRLRRQLTQAKKRAGKVDSSP